ncbi:hypothetical protein C6Q11_11435 [Burkholderia multivorans]|nr:hypothetical protein C6Q11_11435 [Burkholderia multivorans]
MLFNSFFALRFDHFKFHGRFADFSFIPFIYFLDSCFFEVKSNERLGSEKRFKLFFCNVKLLGNFLAISLELGLQLFELSKAFLFFLEILFLFFNFLQLKSEQFALLCKLFFCLKSHFLPRQVGG